MGTGKILLCLVYVARIAMNLCCCMTLEHEKKVMQKRICFWSWFEAESMKRKRCRSSSSSTYCVIASRSFGIQCQQQ